MPRQSLLRLIKRWKRYELRGNWGDVPQNVRGVYVLYQKMIKKNTTSCMSVLQGWERLVAAGYADD